MSNPINIVNDSFWQADDLDCADGWDGDTDPFRDDDDSDGK